MKLTNAKVGEFYQTKKGIAEVAIIFDADDQNMFTIDVIINNELRIYNSSGSLNSARTDRDDWEIQFQITKEENPEYFL